METFIFPRVTTRSYPEPNQEQAYGRFVGQSTTQHFYFSCPDCSWILQAEPLKAELIEDGKALILYIGVYCSQCHLTDVVTIPAQTGWTGGYFE